MPHSDRPAPKRADPPGDDLRKIGRISLAIQKRLYDAGIRTYAELASRTPADLAEVAKARYTPQRITAEDWIGQARALAEPHSAAAEPTAEVPEPGQGHASFQIEFLLGSGSNVRSTRVLHVETGRSGNWAGWDIEQLLGFLRDAGASIPAPREAAVHAKPPPTERPSEPPLPEPPPAEPVAPEPTLPKGFLRIEELTATRGGDRATQRRADEPSALRLRLRAETADIAHARSFDVSAEFAARRWDTNERLPLGTKTATLRPGEALSMNLTDAPSVPPGLYHLDVTLSVYPAGHTPAAAPLLTSGATGDLILVDEPEAEAASASVSAGR